MRDTGVIVVMIKKVYLRYAVVLSLTLLAVGSLIYSQLVRPKASSVGGQIIAVILAEDGFTPAEVKIHQGDTVKFTTTRDKPFWPASNLHPTHEIYPEFDPKRPIDPKDAWTFRFDKIGSWRFHDHLSPYYTGTIVVESGSSTSSQNCDSSTDKPQCWADAVEKIINDQGVDKAFDYIASVYQNDPSAAESCHALTHQAGFAAFKLFSLHKEFKVTEKASFCNYGFYHGFMERLITSGTNLKSAGQFCEYIDRQLKATAPASGLQCYHGIGHGTVSSHDPSKWGNDKAMIDPALELCKQASANDDQLFRCVSGVYNGIGNFYVTGEYKLSVRKDDPFWICRDQPKDFQGACFGNLHPTITWLADKDLSKAIGIIELGSSGDNELTALRYVAGDMARFSLNKTDFLDSIKACRTAESNLVWPCLTGFVTGLMDQGTPNSEYVTAVNYCKSSGLTEEERNKCFGYIFPYLATMYTKEKFDSICSSVEDPIKKYCHV